MQVKKIVTAFLLLAPASAISVASNRKNNSHLLIEKLKSTTPENASELPFTDVLQTALI